MGTFDLPDSLSGARQDIRPPTCTNGCAKIESLEGEDMRCQVGRQRWEARVN